MKNIELFDEYAARILAEAYESFPVKKTIKATSLCGHEDVNDYGEIVDENGNRSKNFEVAYATLMWLFDTGYLRGDVHQFGLMEAVLTAQGLAVLKSTPESVSGKKSTGEALSRLVREGSWDGAKKLISSALVAGGSVLFKG